MKTLVNICLAYISRNVDRVGRVDYLPHECTEWLLDWLSAHDRLAIKSICRLVEGPRFIASLRRISFYMSEEVTDPMLIMFGRHNKHLQQVTIVFCTKITSKGVSGITKGQRSLNKLELRGLAALTSTGLVEVRSPELITVDLSECTQVDSAGLIHLIVNNKAIQRLYINNCRSLDDLAIYAIGAHLGQNLQVLEMDFLPGLSDPSLCLNYLTERCPLLKQLSLCGYFDSIPQVDRLHFNCEISSGQLTELDLYGNYLNVLPVLPKQIKSIRLSFTGSENLQSFSESLAALTNLTSLRIVVNCTDMSSPSVNDANGLLCALLPQFGSQIIGLQLSIPHIHDSVMWLILDHCANMVSLSLNVLQLSLTLLQYIVQEKERAAIIKSLKFHQVRLPHKTLVTIARSCANLEEIEVAWIDSVDDRFLKLLAWNCPNLRSINLNGCSWVTDKGVCEIARRCPLREIRVRATGCSDRCVYVLAQCCPDLEWISHADYSGKPTFSVEALSVLKDACVQRVIC